MLTIAVIPARGGSKGLPRKNVLPLAGKPLVAWSVEHALEAKVCDAVVVSTDDDEIERIASATGAEVVRRPAELAADDARVEQAVKHALEAYERRVGKTFDIVVYLQPTDVFRTPKMIAECVNRLKADDSLDSVFSAYATHKNFWRKNPDGPGFVKVTPEFGYVPRQQREHIYREDTGVACATRARLIRDGKRIGPRVDIVPTHDTRTGIDIHTAFDFWIADQVMRHFSMDKEPEP